MCSSLDKPALCGAACAGIAAHPGQGAWQRSAAAQIQVRGSLYVPCARSVLAACHIRFASEQLSCLVLQGMRCCATHLPRCLSLFALQPRLPHGCLRRSGATARGVGREGSALVGGVLPEYAIGLLGLLKTVLARGRLCKLIALQSSHCRLEAGRWSLSWKGENSTFCLFDCHVYRTLVQLCSERAHSLCQFVHPPDPVPAGNLWSRCCDKLEECARFCLLQFAPTATTHSWQKMWDRQIRYRR